jgi:gluconate 2-dehydrogenase gamma chain
MSDDMRDEMMRRRELLRRAAWMLGGAISAPAALAILQGCSAKDAAVTATSFKPKFLTAPSHMEIVTEIADILIPRTTTSGALDAGVPAFIDGVLAAVYPKDAQQHFTAGLTEFAAGGGGARKPFLRLDRKQREVAVKKSLEEALAAEQKPKPFILMAREITLLGFFTSEVGITENMEYVAVPTVYHGCVPLSAMKKHVYWE